MMDCGIRRIGSSEDPTDPDRTSAWKCPLVVATKIIGRRAKIIAISGPH